MSKLRIVFNSLDFPVSYSCQGRLTTEKGVSESEVKFLYDLAFPSSMNAETARAEIESNLLKQVATAYELFNGMACDGEPTGGGLWLLKASSDPQDAPNPFFGKLKRASINELTRLVTNLHYPRCSSCP